MNWFIEISIFLAIGLLAILINTLIIKFLSDEMLRKQKAWRIEIFRAHPYREFVFHFATAFLLLSLLEQ